MGELGDRWLEEWAGFNRRYVAARDSQGAVLELANRYRDLSQGERQIVDLILAEAALADEEWKRFDALALINEFGIVSALPMLQLSGPPKTGPDRVWYPATMSDQLEGS